MTTKGGAEEVNLCEKVILFDLIKLRERRYSMLST